DNVDIKCATEHGVLVLNTPNSVVAPTSEMTMTLILSIARSVCWYDRTFREDLTCHKDLLLERDMCLEGKKLGIIGFGRIGKSVASKAKAFGMEIIYYDRFRSSAEVEKEYGATYLETPEEVLKQADVVTIHMAYTPESRHFINKERLALMKPSAYLINASRGPIVSEVDLYECLKNHGIRGAALDVHESEPHVSKDIASLENVVITPHICTNIAEIRMNMFGELVIGLSGYLKEGKRPVNLVNRDVWKEK
ncbi:MAG: NAD(P)-binding domain-containing protein, partial [Sphaerochaetaceae bacterium]|nr:NAD(P)-binding domain-containing protein [Sphaerochaetaceae bacterium]